jgi:hypothetical protein
MIIKQGGKMKSFKIVFLIIISTCISSQKIKSNAVITFFIKEKKVKEIKSENHNERIVSKSLQQPSFVHGIEKDRSWLDQPGVDGLYASYLGYLTVSDKNGQITFPRQQQNDIIHLLITPEVQPEFMISPTLIHNWITKKKSPADFYEINRKKNKKLQTYYFDIKKIKIPEKIPMNTIIIYSDPDTINLDTGIFLNTYSTNFILPDLQAKKINSIKNSLYTLSIKQYFEQINIESENDMQTISSMVMNQ